MSVLHSTAPQGNLASPQVPRELKEIGLALVLPRMVAQGQLDLKCGEQPEELQAGDVMLP